MNPWLAVVVSALLIVGAWRVAVVVIRAVGEAIDELKDYQD